MTTFLDPPTGSSATAASYQPFLMLDGFEGPLELLLTLIEHRRLPITQISLAQVADQYLAQVRALPELDADLLADFLSIGAKLLLLKSRALLLTDEPDPEAEETAAELEHRLAEYRVFRTVAQYLQELERSDSRTHPSLREPPGVDWSLAPLAPLALTTLAATLRRLQKAQPEPPANLDLLPRITIEEARDRVLSALSGQQAVSFRAVAGRSVQEILAVFLAVLELFRRGLVDVSQRSPFDDLTITAAVPHG